MRIVIGNGTGWSNVRVLCSHNISVVDLSFPVYTEMGNQTTIPTCSSPPPCLQKFENLSSLAYLQFGGTAAKAGEQ